MANVDAAHKALGKFCGNRPGIGLAKELFQYLINKAVKDSNGLTTNFRFTSNTPFDDLDVSFRTVTNATKAKIFFAAIPGPQPTDSPKSILVMQDLAVAFSVYVSLPNSTTETLMSTNTILYHEITMSFVVDGKRLRLATETIAGKWVVDSTLPEKPVEPWRTMIDLPNGHPFFGTDLHDEWAIQDRAFQLLSKNDLGRSMVESVDVPDVLGMVNSFTFAGPLQVAVEPDLVMLTGEAVWKIDCPRRAANPPVQILSPPHHVLDEAKEDGVGSVEVQIGLPDNSADSSYPPHPEVGRSETGDLFIHLPVVFMEHRFDGVIKPSVTFSDEGGSFIHWHYEAAVAPANAGDVRVSLEKIWPTEFKVSIMLNCFGSAGAGVKIACVYFEALGAEFQGNIRPFEVTFQINFDFSQFDLYFESKLVTINAQNFHFQHWPHAFKFPIDAVADVILGFVAEAIGKDQAGRVLSVTRFSLANLSLLRGFGPLQNALAAVSDADGTSTIGLSFTKT